MLRKFTRHEPPTWLLVTAIIFFITIISFSLLAWGYNHNYKGKSYPGVFVGLLNVGGLTELEVLTKVNDQIDKINEEGVIFAYDNKQAIFYPAAASSDADVVRRSIDFDQDAILEQVMNSGRNNNLFSNLGIQIKGLLSNIIITPSYTINDKDVINFLKLNFNKDLAQSKDARLVFKDGEFAIEPEVSGTGLNNQRAIIALDQAMINFDNQAIKLVKTTDQPEIKQADLTDKLSLANSYLALSPLTLTYNKKSWKVESLELGKWLTFSRNQENSLIIGLDASTTDNYLMAKINPDIEVKMTDARFDLKNGKATSFSTARDGFAVNATATRAKITNEFIVNKNNTIEIETKKIASTISSTTNATELGLKEIVGTGESNFAGSSASRRTNIRIGMSYLNGLLIAPGETFSVMKKLGAIDGSKGYLEELVIKGNETKKEFGGGLCQIGTTMFRAALASGLPIVERRNHSYRVSYYEPAGTDATIYDPSPDLKFLNDTGNYLLIQGRMSGNNLKFDFYGTKDGRKIEKSYPKIFNIVKPAPAKLVETLALPAGTKKCTEKAHNGADATFNYKVTYTDGTVKNKNFSSHYVPWQEVCLIGVKKLSIGSSTPSTTVTTPSTLEGEGRGEVSSPTSSSTPIKTPSTSSTTKIITPTPVATTTKTN